MSDLRIFLFGKFCVRCPEQVVVGLEAQKVQELYCYLLLYRERPHVREKLANILWDGSSTSQIKSYLRQSLWQLQSILSRELGDNHNMLLVDTDWIQINAAANFWLDVDEFERAFALVQGVRGRELDPCKFQALHNATQLYRGDLLENWYADWCIIEQERFQNMYLTMLVKLIEYCEAHHDYETGIAYGYRILAMDHAHEQTYRRLMRLRYLAGDRTGALREYKNCVTALKKELDVQPSKLTDTIYKQIRADQIPASTPTSAKLDPASETASVSLPEVLDRFNQLRLTLVNTQRQVERDIESIKMALKN